MEIKEIRELSPDAIQQKLKELRQELLRLRLNKASCEKVHQFKSTRRTIARLETILREKTLLLNA
jgi:ribosomal protein L29